MGARIALVTGATGGLGRVFVDQLLEEDGLDELWAVARTAQKLERLRDELGSRVVPLPVDLANASGLRTFARMLEEERPTVAYLVNNAGTAKMGAWDEFSVGEIERTVALNCTAVTALCRTCLPFMGRGSRILNVSSASAFQPTPYLSLYAATKAFELSYSRALRAELAGTGVTVCGVCPSWVDTDLLVREVNGRRVAFPGLVPPEKVVARALRDARRGRELSVYPLYAKYLHAAAKVVPQRVVMATWLRMLKRYEG